MNKYAAEFYGTFLLLIAITGTFHLLNNVLIAPPYLIVLSIAFAVGAILYTNITLFMNISGAHFNPAITFMMYLRGKINQSDALIYSILQILGVILGVIFTHLMFGENIFSISNIDRSSNFLTSSIGASSSNLSNLFWNVALISCISCSNHSS